MNDLMKPDSVIAPWMQVESEPAFWYRRFISYYLPLGPTRTLMRAWLKCIEIEQPERAARQGKNNKNAASQWSEKSREWKWRERADAFDLYNASEYAGVVDQARATLLKSSDEAAKALVANLTNPRLAVAAAKEILDRAGLPGTHIVGVGHLEPYTADDLRKAEEEVSSWERQVRGDIIDVTPNS